MKLIVLTILLTCFVGAGTAAAQKNYTYRVVRSYPHDPQAYTQGLFYNGGLLYESTGQYGRSDLRIVDLESGTSTMQRALEPRYFGEGATMFGNLIYQLTWREGVCIVYDARTLTHKYQLRYAGEGWGLTSSGSELIMSDGSHIVRFLDPQTLRERRRISVHTAKRTISLLNELELINGELWANIYTTTQIARIDTATGVVTGIIDLAGILPSVLRTKNTEVLNGIAYDAVGKRIFVTGKNWSRLFEIVVVEKK